MPGILDIRAIGRTNGGRNRELQHLSRQDLLELLVGQLRENDELRAAVESRDHDARERSELIDHLKERLDLKDERISGLRDEISSKDEQAGRLMAKLDDKDAQIARLKDRLDDKDAKLERLKRRLDDKDRIIAGLVDVTGVDPTAVAIIEACNRAGEAAGGEERHE